MFLRYLSTALMHISLNITTIAVHISHLSTFATITLYHFRSKIKLSLSDYVNPRSASVLPKPIAHVVHRLRKTRIIRLAPELESEDMLVRIPLRDQNIPSLVQVIDLDRPRAVTWRRFASEKCDLRHSESCSNIVGGSAVSIVTWMLLAFCGLQSAESGVIKPEGLSRTLLSV